VRGSFRPEARRELLEARQWYEQHAQGLGAEFSRAADAAVASVLRDPLRLRVFAGEYRRILLRRFPYALVYRVWRDEIVFVGCFHHRRDPAELLRRLKP
jgi:plasmid stabilization system protein ParE